MQTGIPEGPSGPELERGIERAGNRSVPLNTWASRAPLQRKRPKGPLGVMRSMLKGAKGVQAPNLVGQFVPEDPPSTIRQGDCAHARGVRVIHPGAIDWFTGHIGSTAASWHSAQENTGHCKDKNSRSHCRCFNVRSYASEMRLVFVSARSYIPSS